MAKREPYPLQWPAGWKRTESWKRDKPKFIARFAFDRDKVIKQLGMRRGSHIVITSDLPTRGDGLPYANARCTDPGIAVYWIEKGHEHVMACDRWKAVEYNLRAIDMSLEAMRGLDRWGASEMVERAFAGFAALPPGGDHEVNVAPPKKTWRDVLDMGAYSALPKADQLAIAKQRHREAIRTAHPDAGGDHDRAADLNAAMAAAELELGR